MFLYEEFVVLYDYVEFFVIILNLFDKNGSCLFWVVFYYIKILKNGMFIVFLGVIVLYYFVYDKLGWIVIDVFESVKEIIQEVKGQVDIIVLLFYLGILDDQVMVEVVFEIDVILELYIYYLFEDG